MIMDISFYLIKNKFQCIHHSCCFFYAHLPPSPAGWQEDVLEASVSGVQGASHPRSVTQQQ